MLRRIHIGLITILLAVFAAGQVYAITLEEAARKAARQYQGKVISARTVVQKGKRVHEIKVITKDGVVKTVRIPE